MIVYTAGPYQAKNGRTVKDHIQTARQVAIELWARGHFALSPHLNTAGFESEPELASISNGDYIQRDLEMLARCDAIVMMPNWEESDGAQVELSYATDHGIPIYYYPDLPERHVTEVRNPEQCTAFMEIIMQMYRTHLVKNDDYSPMNILATGEIGLVTRLWDKIARLMNLTGFRVNIADAKYIAPRNPKNESINDTYMDAAVYSVIGLLVRQGKWGR